MGKRIFWIFFLTIASLTVGVVLYIQSQRFANFIKKELGGKLAAEAGIEVEFERIKVNILPPGFSMVHVKVRPLRPDNVLGVPVDAILESNQLGITIKTIQAFLG
jgi:hypothetical protein